METPVRRLAAAAAFLLAACLPVAGDRVPFWGAQKPEPVGTDPRNLKPGQFTWRGDAAPNGPLVIVVSLTEQLARVYRNGLCIGTARVSTGKTGHETPTGVFTILNKDKDHRSKNYNDAPMPYSERLTWDGVALHAGGLPGYPSSHGCVHLPTRFAELLFAATAVGMTVVIASDAVAPVAVAHPPLLSPVGATGADDELSRLTPDETSRWHPENAPEGPVTIVVSAADRRIIVLRNGTEIGRTRIALDDPDRPLGNGAFVLESVAGATSDARTPAGMCWTGIPLPGAAFRGGADMNPDNAGRVHVPAPFVTDVFGILTPGATLYVTDLPVLPETTGPTLNVLNSDPPPGTP